MKSPRRRFPRSPAVLLLVALAAGSAWLAAEAAPARVIRGSGAAASRENRGDGRLAWHELEPALAEAKRVGKPVMVHVYTDWCGWCKRMDQSTYGQADVRDYVARKFVPARVNAEDDRRRATYEGEDLTYRQFADAFRISRYPTTLFLTPDGALISQVPGYVKPGPFLGVLQYVAGGHYKTRTYDAYIHDGDVPTP